MLREQEFIRQFDVLLDTLPLEIALVDGTGKIVAVNKGWRDFARENGLTQADAAVGQNYLKVCFQSTGEHSAFSSEAAEGITSVIKGQLQDFELDYPCAAPGETRWYRMRVRPVQKSDNYVLVTHDNITREHVLEEQLRMAHKLESIGHLTGGIAHDFNNMLTVVMGNAGMLIDLVSEDEAKADKDEILEMAELILSAGQSGADLTQRLLAFARRQPDSPELVDVNKLVNDMEPLLRSTLGDNVEIQWIQSAGLWQTLVDPSQLQNALLNLCINAVDAMPEGGKLTIETANTHKDDAYTMERPDIRTVQYVMIGVTDTGVGMDGMTVQKVFEPFFTTKPKGKGAGLGLSMVFGFVKQSGGHVDIDSQPGEGTRIRLYLPKVTDAHSPASTPQKSDTTESCGTGRILLVEDDTMVRKFAEDVLTRAGYQVFAASHGQQALEILDSQGGMSLIIIDVVMPGMSGIELAENVANAYPQMKALYISGYTGNSGIHNARLDHSVQLLRKPFRRQELLGSVQSLLPVQGRQ